MTPQMLSYQDEYEREHCAKGKKSLIWVQYWTWTIKYKWQVKVQVQA